MHLSTSTKLNNILKLNGILHEYSCLYSPEQNRGVERKHKDILNIERALNLQASLPIKFWGFCVLAASINTYPE